MEQFPWSYWDSSNLPELGRSFRQTPPQFQDGKGCKVDQLTLGVCVKYTLRGWGSSQRIWELQQGPQLLFCWCYTLHISYCWSRVNLYLLNVQCLGVAVGVFWGVYLSDMLQIYLFSCFSACDQLVPSVLPARSCPA